MDFNIPDMQILMLVLLNFNHKLPHIDALQKTTIRIRFLLAYNAKFRLHKHVLDILQEFIPFLFYKSF